jgi:signal transduction histidine kinase
MSEKTLRALLVEDDPDDVFLLKDMLAALPGPGLDLERVADLAAGLERARSGGLDVALLDLNLPDSQGMETFERLHDAAPDLPVVVLTGHNDEAAAVEAVQKGAQDYLVKGQVDGNLLVRSVRYAIERQRNSTFRALLAERERFDAAIAQAGDGILATDGGLRITSANRASQLLLNLVDGRWRGASLEGVLAPFTLSVTPQELRESREPVMHLEVSRPDTLPALYLDAKLSRLFDTQGRLSSTVLIVRDVTDERLARHVQASFFSLVPHKLRTPLAILGGYLEVSRHLPPQRMAQEWPEILEVCEGALAQVTDIVQKLLDFNALNTWQLAHETRQTLVAQVVGAVVDAVRARYPDRELRVDTEVAPEAASVDATAEHLTFVLTQLLDNAAKFVTAEPVEVRVRVTRASAREIQFSVADNGPGIPHEYLDRVFEGFVQVEEHVTGQIPGLGVGLSLARHVLQTCGGTISVHSALGVGSEFVFTLPAPAESAAEAVPEGPQERLAAG